MEEQHPVNLIVPRIAGGDGPLNNTALGIAVLDGVGSGQQLGVAGVIDLLDKGLLILVVGIDAVLLQRLVIYARAFCRGLGLPGGVVGGLLAQYNVKGVQVGVMPARGTLINHRHRMEELHSQRGGRATGYPA